MYCKCDTTAQLSLSFNNLFRFVVHVILHQHYYQKRHCITSFRFSNPFFSNSRAYTRKEHIKAVFHVWCYTSDLRSTLRAAQTSSSGIKIFSCFHTINVSCNPVKYFSIFVELNGTCTMRSFASCYLGVLFCAFCTILYFITPGYLLNSNGESLKNILWLNKLFRYFSAFRGYPEWSKLFRPKRDIELETEIVPLYSVGLQAFYTNWYKIPQKIIYLYQIGDLIHQTASLPNILVERKFFESFFGIFYASER